MKYNFAEIGNTIVNLRKGQKMSQEKFLEELSKRGVKIARNRLSKIENGEQLAFDLDFLLGCCEIFETDIGHLMGEYSAKTLDTEFICKSTGLSEKAVSDLVSYSDYAPHINGVLNLLLENGLFRVVQEIYTYYDFFAAHESEKVKYQRKSKKIWDKIRDSDFVGATALAIGTKATKAGKATKAAKNVLSDTVLESHEREVKALRLGIYETFISIVDCIVKTQYDANKRQKRKKS